MGNKVTFPAISRQDADNMWLDGKNKVLKDLQNETTEVLQSSEIIQSRSSESISTAIDATGLVNGIVAGVTMGLSGNILQTLQDNLKLSYTNSILSEGDITFETKTENLMCSWNSISETKFSEHWADKPMAITIYFITLIYNITKNKNKEGSIVGMSIKTKREFLFKTIRTQRLMVAPGLRIISEMKDVNRKLASYIQLYKNDDDYKLQKLLYLKKNYESQSTNINKSSPTMLSTDVTPFQPVKTLTTDIKDPQKKGNDFETDVDALIKTEMSKIDPKKEIEDNSKNDIEVVSEVDDYKVGDLIKEFSRPEMQVKSKILYKTTNNISNLVFMSENGPIVYDQKTSSIKIGKGSVINTTYIDDVPYDNSAINSIKLIYSSGKGYIISKDNYVPPSSFNIQNIIINPTKTKEFARIKMKNQSVITV